MDEITKSKLILNYLIDYLKKGNYVRFTNMYMGSLWDGEKSKDRFKIKKENIKFVNGDTVNTIYGETLRLQPVGIEVNIQGNIEVFKKYIVIDINDWTIYLWDK